MASIEYAEFRSDTEDLFRMKLAPYKEWSHTPVWVLLESGEVVLVRKRGLLEVIGEEDPEAPCFCPWPGEWRQDIFSFPAGRFAEYMKEHEEWRLQP